MSKKNLKQGKEPKNKADKEECKDDIMHPSAKFLLPIVQKEYENEANRMKNLEARTGMFIAFSGALLVFIANNIKLANFNMAKIVTISQSFPYWFYLSCVIFTLISLLYGLCSFIKVVSVAEYSRLDVEKFPENVCHKEEINALSLMELYVQIISHNSEINDSKAKFFKRGLKSIQIALILNVIAYVTTYFII